jgi:hypothetical protein
LIDELAVSSDGICLSLVPGRGRDVYGHGTAIASIIKRVAPAALIGSFRVFNGELRSRTEIIRQGVRAAIDRGYHILNCSFGCPGSVQYIMQYKEWIDEAYLKGVHIVSACNNEDPSKPEWPGHFPSVITVNMAPATGLTFFQIKHQLVEFAAAGERIDVPWNEGRRKNVTGSSYAAALMTGLLARLLSEEPDLTPLEAKSLLQRLAQPYHAG